MGLSRNQLFQVKAPPSYIFFDMDLSVTQIYQARVSANHLYSVPIIVLRTTIKDASSNKYNVHTSTPENKTKNLLAKKASLNDGK